mmetsp:Transcript_24939/g.36871  ORF Transcript_24939/g.36871 Transcript_24939/m.36871 type:complete len:188 (+) Transcript_24939:121-684(+)
MTNLIGILCSFVVILASEASLIPSSRSSSKFSPSVVHDGGGWHNTLQFDKRRLSGKKDKDCAPVTECETCTGSERKKQPSCKKTGRVQRFECKQSEVILRSCKRSKEDEVFLMMELQIFCFLIGSIALVNVRKHKSSSSSLFDQRKADKRLRKNSVSENGDDVEIEFSSMAGQQNTEMEPLRPINII